MSSVVEELVTRPLASEDITGNMDKNFTKRSRKSELDQSIENLQKTKASLKRMEHNIQKQLHILYGIRRKYKPTIAVVEAEEAIAKMRAEL